VVQTDEERKAKEKKYKLKPDVKAKAKVYRDNPINKAKKKEWDKIRFARPEIKAIRKQQRETPEARAKGKIRRSKYQSRPEVIARRKELRERPEAKEKARKHRDRPEVKARKLVTERKWRVRPEVKSRQKVQRDKPDVKEKRHKKQLRFIRDLRLEILLKYSKRLSNSDVPICHCCGECFHVDFLAIDHILGKKQMDSIPELVKIGYSSTLDKQKLWAWIRDNDYPDGFQILCHNCNTAKAYPKNNNKCPHEMK